MTFFKTLFLVSSLSICSTYSFGKSSNVPVKGHDDENLGWSFYWDDEKEKKEEIKKNPETPSTQGSPKKVKAFSTEWIKENLKKVERAAIDNPSKENMKALLYLERVLLDKSEVFARKKQYYQSTIPELQEGVRLPTTVSSASAFRQFKAEQRLAAVKEIAKHAGLVFFYDHNCSHCATMINTVNRLHRVQKQNIYVIARGLKPNQKIPRLDRNISVFPDSGQAETFNIKVWPAIAILKPPLDVLVVTQGAVYYSELEKRIVNTAFENNILSKDWFYRVYPEQKGLLSANQLNDIPDGLTDDPESIVKYITNITQSPEGVKIETDKVGLNE